MGYVIDMMGRPICFIILLILVATGQSIFARSAHQTINSYWLAI